LKPAGADGASGSRTFFDHHVEPGHAVRDLARLANLTDHPLTFNLYAADAYTTPDGGFALRLEGDPREGVGAWVSLPTGAITVPAKSAVTFPLQIGVPADATPGDWAGGVVASIAAPAEGPDGPSGVVIEQGVAARVYVQVAGPLEPALSVRDVDLDLDGGSWAPLGHSAGARVSYDVANTGNTRISGKAHVEISDALGRTIKTLPDQTFKDLLPSEDLTFTESWEGIPLTGMRLRARVVATTDGVSSESWSPGAWHPPVLVILLLITLVVVGALAIRRLQVTRPSQLGRHRAEPVRS
jgi:hypothetical protein